MKKLPYKEGDWFAVPLSTGGYSVGRITRMTNKGKVLLGYFFKLRRESIPKLEELEKLSPEKAMAIYRFGDLDLYKGNWPVIGTIEPWRREEWPIPPFVRHEDFTDRYWKVIYSDNDPNEPVNEERIHATEAHKLTEDSLYGSGALEIQLTKLLKYN